MDHFKSSTSLVGLKEAIGTAMLCDIVYNEEHQKSTKMPPRI